MCVLLCVAVSHQTQLLCLLCTKDGSPVSTCSSSPKLDWMIKRGMVGLSQTVSSFIPARLSLPFVSCLFLFFFHWFCLRGCSSFPVSSQLLWLEFSVDSLVLRMLLCWLKTTKCCCFFYFYPVPASTKPVAERDFIVLECHIVAIFILVCSPMFYPSWWSYFPRCNTHMHTNIIPLRSLPLFPQIPLTQSTVMDDVEKWLALDDEVNL